MANVDFGSNPAPAAPPGLNGGQQDGAAPMSMPQGMAPLGGADPQALAAAMPQGPQISPAHQKLLTWANQLETKNIASELTDEELGKIGERVKREYTIDKESRTDWLDKSKAAMELASQVTKTKDYPWPKASNLIYPLVTVAAQSFASRAYPAIVAGRNVVKGVVYGDDEGVPQMAPDGTQAIQPAQPGDPNAIQGPNGQAYSQVWKVKPGALRERAENIGEHMSYQLLEEQEGWDADTDTLLHVLPIVGCHFRKTYFDPNEGKNISCLVGAKELVINYKAKSMTRAPRITEVIEMYPTEVEEMMLAGLFKREELGEPEGGGDDQDAPHIFLEQHRNLDLDDDKYPEPYIVTVHERSGKVMRIVARYDADGIKVSKSDPNKIVKIDKVHYYTKFDFMPSTDGGIYGVGFGQLLSPINAGINTTLNMLIDSGHLQTVGGGFIGKGISMHSGSIRFKPGEFKVVNTPGAAIRDAIVPFETAGPSAVLFQLLGFLVQAGKEIAATNDVLEGSSNMAQMQPTTMLALIEQGLKVFAAIYKRVHRSLKQEYEKLFRLNRVYLEETTSYQVGDEWKQITRDDYIKGAGVCPYSDPEMVSDMQRLARAQFLLTFKDDPRMDGGKIIKSALDAGKIEQPEQYFAQQPAPDPVIMATVAESQSKVSLNRSNEIKNYAQGVYYLAQADKIEGDMDMGWVTTQLDILRTRFEMTNGQAQPGAQQPPAIPGGQGGGDETPPVHGARKAKDGQWYAPDPSRPGKYLQVIADAGGA